VRHTETCPLKALCRAAFEINKMTIIMKAATKNKGLLIGYFVCIKCFTITGCDFGFSKGKL